MPTIPIADGKGGGGGYGIPDAPTSFGRTGSGLEGVGAEISKLGDIANKIGAVNSKIQAQEVENEFASTQTMYENRIKRTFQEMETDADVINEPAKYSDIFAQKARDIQEEIRAGIKSPVVGQAFNRYLKDEYPKNLIAANNIRNKRQGELQIAEVDAQGDALSNLAAEATPAKRQEYEDRHKNLVDSLFLKGHINAVQHRNRLTNYKSVVLEKNMDILSRGNLDLRNRLFDNVAAGIYADVDPLKKTKYLEQAEKVQLREDNHRTKMVNQASDMIKQHYYALANFGQLPESELETLANNSNPLITADDAAAIVNRNRKPLFGGSDAPVRVILSDMNGEEGPITREKVERARTRLNKLREDSGATEAIDDALKYLQTQHGNVRSLESQELSATKSYAEQVVKSQSKTSPFPSLNQRAKNKQAIDIAEINKRIIDGKVRDKESAAKIVEEVLKRRPGTKPTNVSEEDELVNKLLR